jgi:hypothetical protein
MRRTALVEHHLEVLLAAGPKRLEEMVSIRSMIKTVVPSQKAAGPGLRTLLSLGYETLGVSARQTQKKPQRIGKRSSCGCLGCGGRI